MLRGLYCASLLDCLDLCDSRLWRGQQTLAAPWHTDPIQARVAVIEQLRQADGPIPLPIPGQIQSASQVIEALSHEIGHRTLEQILVASASAGARSPKQPCAALS